MILTTSQQKIVDKLFHSFINYKENKNCYLKAPTGSGKTFMASEFISRVFSHNKSRNKKTMIIIATVSNAELPKQFANKLLDYKKYHEYQKYNIEYIQSPSASKSTKIEDIPDFKIEDQKVFVFGVSSFGKNTLFYQDKTIHTFLQQVQHYDYDLIYIRDEAHIGRKESINKDDLKTFDELVKNSSKFILEMTATPKTPINLIEMLVKDLESDNHYLLKDKEIKSKLIGDDITNEEIIDDAITTFKKSKKEYQKLDDIINPAMLIQVVNQPSEKLDKVGFNKFNDSLAILEDKLKKAGLSYLKYLDSKPVVINASVPATLKYASQIDSQIDAVIFKVGPATGWDIPRANMLLQLRNVSSKQLNVQTLGRIMRNPYPGLKKHNTTNKYYVWSNYQKPTRELAYYKIKEKFKNIKLPSGYIDRNVDSVKNDDTAYIEEVKDFIKSKEFQNKLKDINSYPNKYVYWSMLDYGDSQVKDKIENHIELKIHNIKKQRLYEDKFYISTLYDLLKNIAQKNNINFEIVLFTLFTFIGKLSEIKNSTNKWADLQQPYKINESNELLEVYKLWKDNANLKKVNTSKIINYGYKQISNEEPEIQYLDSMPEKAFYDNFVRVLNSEQKSKIKFFAKMPTLGSKIYWEYYNKKAGSIIKTYVDFVIIYNEKIIFIEVKGFEENDYDSEKTLNLLSAYKKYQNAYKHKNIDFAVFNYKADAGKNDETQSIEAEINGKWEKKVYFPDFVAAKLK